MDQERLSKLPGKSIRYLLLCAGGMLSIILLTIYPQYKSLGQLEKEIKKIQTQIEEQEILYPVYRDLFKQIKPKEPGGVSMPQKAKLDRARTDRISSVLEEMAQQSNLKLVAVVPDVKSLSDRAGLLSVSTQLKGSFFDFRGFLLLLGRIPFLERIEEVRIKPVEGGREFGLTTLFALKK